MKVHELIEQLKQIPNQESEISFTCKSPHIIEPHRIDNVERVNSSYYIVRYVNDSYFDLTDEQIDMLDGRPEEEW